MLTNAARTRGAGRRLSPSVGARDNDALADPLTDPLVHQSPVSLADEHHEEWSERQALAEAMIPIIGRLYRQNNVVTSIYGRRLINESAIHLIKAHRFARRIDDVELDLHDTLPVLQALAAVDPGRLGGPARLTGSTSRRAATRPDGVDAGGARRGGRPQGSDRARGW